MTDDFKLSDNVSIHETAFVAPNATIHGNVKLGPHSSVWFGAVVRAEMASVTIGARSNVQDGAVLHVDEGFPVVLAENVTVGHRAVIHGAKVDNDCIIGIGAILLNGCHIGAQSIVAAGAVVPEGKSYPPGSMLMGIPAKVVRELTPAERERVGHGADHYVAYGAAYRERLGT